MVPLAAFFKRTPRFALAYSGGCDSSYLLAAALQAGCEVKAYCVRTAFQPVSEIDDACRLAQQLDANFEIIDIDILAHGDICANPPDRCYLCKKLIFSTIKEHMAHDGYEVLADGTNAMDDPNNRPGFRALAEYKVISPLRQANMTKDDIRASARTLGLFTADKPSFSCYAVHVPAGTCITAQTLERAAASLHAT